jgi:opacity protein-like surface antigen
MINKLNTALAALFFATNSMVATANTGDTYAAVRIGSSNLNLDNLNFTNPRVTGVKTTEDDKEKARVGSIAFGKSINIEGNPARVEIEFSDYSKETFESTWAPFVNWQRVTVESKSLMVNTLFDKKFESGTIFAGIGLGFARNESSAEQQTSGRFNSNTETSFAYSLMAGGSTPVSDGVELELMYKYADLGDIETGWDAFNTPADEKWDGDLKSSQVSLGLVFKL